MFFAPVLFSPLVFGLSLITVSTTLADAKAQCKTILSGPLYTFDFVYKGNNEIAPYYFNSENYVAFDVGNQHPGIQVQFQNCTPNYAQEGNQVKDRVVYGRLYIPDKNACMAVTNPSGSPPYYVSYKTCPSAADMATKASIPFNFVGDTTMMTEMDIRWAGATIPSKKIWQGPDPPAKYCKGRYSVNATNAQSGYTAFPSGKPNTAKSEDYRIHLYCPTTKTGGTAYNSFNIFQE